MLELPRARIASIQELATRLLESRKPGTPLDALARDLLVGFHGVCMHWGLDRLISELEQTFPPLDLSDRSALADHPTLPAALVAQLGAINLDGGGPRNAKPGQVADCVVAALTLTVVDNPAPAFELDDKVRAGALAALASVVDRELALPHLRETIVARARAGCEERHLAAFDKMVAQLDERGLRIGKQPKVPLDAQQAVQQLLFEARNAVFDRVARTAIDGAKQVIARASAETAARIDEPITLKMTPRDVAILRASDSRVPKVPANFVASLIDALTELVRIAWRAAEKTARPYAATQTFAVGELIEHPKFGRGSVVSAVAQRIEVEFPDGKHTLVHRPSK